MKLGTALESRRAYRLKTKMEKDTVKVFFTIFPLNCRFTIRQENFNINMTDVAICYNGKWKQAIRFKGVNFLKIRLIHWQSSIEGKNIIIKTSNILEILKGIKRCTSLAAKTKYIGDFSNTRLFPCKIIGKFFSRNLRICCKNNCKDMISGFKGVLKRVNKFNVSLNALLVYITILEVSWSLGDVERNVYSE